MNKRTNKWTNKRANDRTNKTKQTNTQQNKTNKQTNKQTNQNRILINTAVLIARLNYVCSVSEEITKDCSNELLRQYLIGQESYKEDL